MKAAATVTKLLRALEAREVRRVGSNAYRSVNVRVVAATNRDLRTDVNSSLRAPKEAAAQLRSPEFLAQLRNAAWPRNVRELRNYVERCLILRTIEPAFDGRASTEEGLAVDPTASYTSERDRAMADFERKYFKALLRLHGGKVARAAGAAGMDRTYLYRLLRRHDIEP